MSEGDKTIGQYFRDWEAHVFGFGYGSGEQHIIPVLKKFMAVVPPDDPEASRNYDYLKLEEAVGAPVAWLLLNVLGHADVIEYGTSPRFGWLTRHGYELKGYLDRTSEEDLLTAVRFDQDYTHCFPDICNCVDECRNPFWEHRKGRTDWRKG